MKNKKKGLLIGLIIAAAVIIVLVGIVVILSGIGFVVFRKPTLKLNDYVTFESTGYDGYGYVSYYIDETKIKEEYGNKIRFARNFEEKMTENAEDDVDLKKEMEAFGIDIDNDDDAIELFCILFLREAYLSKKDDISNGDVIVFSWGYSDDEEDKKEVNKLCKLFGVKIDYSDIEYTVEGLETVPQFDPFEDVVISYSGFAPSGQALIANYPDNGLNYSIENSTELSNGDEITVVAEVPYGMDSYISMYGNAPMSTSKTYTVENLPEYITSFSQISDDVLSEMKTQTEDIIQGTTYGWRQGYTLDVNYIGNYFLTAKQATNTDQNAVILVYKLHYQNSFKEYTGEIKDFGIDYYFYVFWKNIYLDSEGNCCYNQNDYYKATHEFTWDTGIYQKLGEFTRKPNNEVKLTYIGYQTLDEIYDFFINKNIEYFKFEDNITE